MFRFRKKTDSTKLIEQVKQGEISYEDAVKQIDLRKLIAELDDVEQLSKDHGNLVDLRQIWGQVILGVLIVTIIGDFALVRQVGTGEWTFSGNSQFLNVVATEHLIQIFGLVLVVLKALFPGGTK